MALISYAKEGDHCRHPIWKVVTLYLFFPSSGVCEAMRQTPFHFPSSVYVNYKVNLINLNWLQKAGICIRAF